MGSLTRTEKKQYLLENGWWAQYHDDCWFESSKDVFWVNGKGEIVGFRPEEEGITLEEAYEYQKGRQDKNI